MSRPETASYARTALLALGLFFLLTAGVLALNGQPQGAAGTAVLGVVALVLWRLATRKAVAARVER